MTPVDPTWEYLHLVAAPFTIVLTAAGALVGTGGWLAGREGLERWGLVALLLAAVMAIPSYFTGLTAADVAATRTFVEPSLVQTHRTWATWTAVVSASVGIFAAFSLYQPDDARLRRFVLVCGLAAAFLAGWTAFLGGKIVHGPEADRERIQESVLRDAAKPREPVGARRPASARPGSFAGVPPPAAPGLRARGCSDGTPPAPPPGRAERGSAIRYGTAAHRFREGALTRGDATRSEPGPRPAARSGRDPLSNLPRTRA